VGGSKTLTTDVRLIAATNEDLPTLARHGKFREDLLDRLAFDVITLPPLRLRPEDILILAERFAVTMAADLGREYFPGFSASARKVLRTYHWPGNIRELKNVVERSVYRSQEVDTPVDVITIDPFESAFRPTQPSTVVTVPAGDDSDEPAVTKVVAPVPSLHEFPIDFRQSVQDYEIGLIKSALASSQFNQKKTADALGVTYHQLRGYLKKYDLLDN
jgi:psp operon transcriptional activator